jgi:hypothetical protein
MEKKGTVGTNQIRPNLHWEYMIQHAMEKSLRHEAITIGENMSSNQAKYCVTCGFQ